MDKHLVTIIDLSGVAIVVVVCFIVDVSYVGIDFRSGGGGW